MTSANILYKKNSLYQLFVLIEYVARKSLRFPIFANVTNIFSSFWKNDDNACVTNH